MPDSFEIPVGERPSTAIRFPRPRLPRELCDHVIDALGPQADSYYVGEQQLQPLRQCTLVCREWLPRAQFWLFKHITIQRPSSLQNFLNARRDGDAILARVHSLRVTNAHMAQSPLSVLATPLGRRLSSLRTLCITSGHSPNAKNRPIHIHPVALRLYTPLTYLAALCLENAYFSSFADLGRLLSHCARIECLMLFDIDCPPDKPGLTPGCMRSDFGRSISTFLHNLRDFVVRRPLHQTSSHLNPNGCGLFQLQVTGISNVHIHRILSHLPPDGLQRLNMPLRQDDPTLPGTF